MIDQRLAAARQEAANLRAERDRVAAASPDRDLAARLLRYRGLVREMREEIGRLESLLPTASTPAPQTSQANAPPATPEAAPEQPSLPPGTRIEGIIAVDADAPNAAVEQALRAADAAVVLTRRTSHRMMWLVRDLAADLGISVAFSRETGWQRTIAETAAVIAKTQKAPTEG